MIFFSLTLLLSSKSFSRLFFSSSKFFLISFVIFCRSSVNTASGGRYNGFSIKGNDNNPVIKKFFPLIKKASTDERNFVKKAVNWALRQIGKRNKKLNTRATKLAKEIQKINSKSAKWVANNAIIELTSENIKKRLI